jgi:protein-disulfide isomerase
MKFRFLSLLLSSFLFLGFSLVPLKAQELTPAQRTQFEGVIKDYLMKNPEIVREAMLELDRKEKDAENQARLKITADKNSPLYTSANNVVVGNPKGDVTLVEFFDYNCGYCKKAVPDLQKLMENDKNIRIILRDMPILSAGSIEAAKVALALRSQLTPEKFWEFHSKLMVTRGSIGEAQALAAARDAGADIDKLTKDMKAPKIATILEENTKMSDSLNITGTPTYVLGSEVMIGAADYNELKSRVDSLRKCGKSTCS